MKTGRDYDVVVMGATGFTGRLVVEYLKERYSDGSLRWAMAGRNLDKLSALKDQFSLHDVPVLLADSHDIASLKELAAQTGVVCTTVGPYERYGEMLVAACAEVGTSYCDLTGEAPFIKRMAAAHDGTAKRTGARLVHCCGVDSVPSDLGVFMVQKAARERYDKPCQEVKGRIVDFSGGFSGGTFESMAGMAQGAFKNAETRRSILDPYSLCSDGTPRGPDGPDPIIPFIDPDFGVCGPFLMATVNTRMVRRSNALMNFAYGRDFSYTEAMVYGKGMGAFMRAMSDNAKMNWQLLSTAIGPLHRAATAMGRPKPGEGPSRESIEQGHFEIAFLGKRKEDNGATQVVRAKVQAERDPGYGATAWMLAESAVCLAKDADQLPVGGGSWTPAACLGERLIARLNELNMVLEVEP